MAPDTTPHQRPYRHLRDTTDDMWSHTIKGTISRIDTKANTLELIADGHRKDTTLEEQAKDLRHISDELRIQVRELFIELERLQKASHTSAEPAQQRIDAAIQKIQILKEFSRKEKNWEREEGLRVAIALLRGEQR